MIPDVERWKYVVDASNVHLPLTLYSQSEMAQNCPEYVMIN